jgi:hypothetical protein
MQDYEDKVHVGKIVKFRLGPMPLTYGSCAVRSYPPHRVRR